METAANGIGMNPITSTYFDWNEYNLDRLKKAINKKYTINL